MAAAEEATTPVPASAEARVQAIFAVFDVFGNGDYIGEAVSQEQHAIQCAKLAADAGSDDATIAGALLHGGCLGPAWVPTQSKWAWMTDPGAPICEVAPQRGAVRG